MINGAILTFCSLLDVSNVVQKLSCAFHIMICNRCDILHVIWKAIKPIDGVCSVTTRLFLLQSSLCFECSPDVSRAFISICKDVPFVP